MFLLTKSLASIAIAALVILGADSTHASTAKNAEVIVASGTLDGKFLADALFHIGEFWMRVPSNTEFHRWLEQGLDRKVVVALTHTGAQIGDEKNVRFLSGTLVHGTAPNPTANTTNVVGRLAKGDLPFVHLLFLKDDATGTFGAVTFETADSATAAKFEGLDNKHITIAIRILQ
jgi:hypothetical protein